MKQRARIARRLDQRASESPLAPAVSVEPVDVPAPAPAENPPAYSIATTSVVPGIRPVAPKIQRDKDESAPPAPVSAPPPPPPLPGASADPLSGGSTGTTTILAPTVSTKVYSGKTLQEVANAMPEEPGSLTFDIGAATDGDPITKATVVVKQAMVVPQWAERDRQCKPIQAAWDRFTSALRQHEDEHVRINRTTLATAHDRYAGRPKNETQDVTTELENETFAAGNAFDTQTDHGKSGTPSTTIDVGVKCDDKSTSFDVGSAGLGGEEEEMLQAKLEVSEPGDPDEEEADRVAEQVMRMAEPGSVSRGVMHVARMVQRCAACEAEEEKRKASGESEGGVRIRRKCAECEAKEREQDEESPDEKAPERVRRKATTGRSEVGESSRVTAVARLGGEPLDAGTRAFMEPRFGFDFGHVRIHADAQADSAARSIRARAYTVGSDVVFGAGHYAPQTDDGRRLLAHELTHVVQQTEGSRSARGPVQRAPDGPAGATPPGTTSTDKSTPSALGTIAEDLQFDLKNKAGRREAILRNTLRAAKQGDELTRLYKERSPNKDADLMKDLKSDVGPGWGKTDSIRAQRYLTHGELRTADKIYFAAIGAGTDWPTIERMLPEVNKGFAAVEQDFSADYKDDYSKKARLPNKQESIIGGVIDEEFPSGTEAPEAIKGKAVIAFGEPQPLDLVRAGTDGDTLLKPLQQAKQSFESVQVLQTRYQERYPESLLQKHIESKLSGDDVTRARMILEGSYSARSRIKLAMGMGIDPDEKEIWAALLEATPTELAQIRDEYKAKGDVYKMFQGGTFTGLSKENLLRLEAMLGAGPDGEDPILTKLKAQGGVSGAEIVKVIKTALKSEWASYRDAYNSGGGPLRTFADELLTPEEKGSVASYLQDKVIDRLTYGVGRQDVEYVTLQVTVFASEEDKKAIVANESLTNAIASFNARDANKIRDLLIPSSLSREEKAKLLGGKISRESSFWMGATANAEALEDEQRELAIILEKAKADGKLTPDEQKKIGDATTRTEGALSAYLGVRDELGGYIETALNIAGSVALAAATGGAGAPMLAAAVARAALAQAVMSVAIKKIVLGDNFDATGPEAAGVFASGFVDGAMNAVGGPAAKSAISAALRDSARVAALETGNVVFASSGRVILTRAAEGTISAAPGAMVGTAVNDGTWKDGFTKGFTAVIESGAQAAALGSATTVGIGAVADAATSGKPDGPAPSLDPNAPKVKASDPVLKGATTLPTEAGHVTVTAGGQLFSCFNPCLDPRVRYARVLLDDAEKLGSLTRLENEAAEAAKGTFASRDELARRFATLDEQLARTGRQGLAKEIAAWLPSLAEKYPILAKTPLSEEAIGRIIAKRGRAGIKGQLVEELGAGKILQKIDAGDFGTRAGRVPELIPGHTVCERILNVKGQEQFIQFTDGIVGFRDGDVIDAIAMLEAKAGHLSGSKLEAETKTLDQLSKADQRELRTQAINEFRTANLHDERIADMTVAEIDKNFKKKIDELVTQSVSTGGQPERDMERFLNGQIFEILPDGTRRRLTLRGERSKTQVIGLVPNDVSVDAKRVSAESKVDFKVEKLDANANDVERLAEEIAERSKGL